MCVCVPRYIASIASSPLPIYETLSRCQYVATIVYTLIALYALLLAAGVSYKGQLHLYSSELLHTLDVHGPLRFLFLQLAPPPTLLPPDTFKCQFVILPVLLFFGGGGVGGGGIKFVTTARIEDMAFLPLFLRIFLYFL